MKRLLFPIWSLVLIFFFTLGVSSWAYEVQPVGVYWDLEVSYGSGSGVGDGVIDSDSDSWLTPGIPHQYSLPRSDSLEVYDTNGYFYSYAEYDADVNYLYVDAEGFADGDYSDNDTDWYSALSKVAIASDPFTGAPLFTLSFDWEVDFDDNMNTSANTGEAKIAVGLIDWTETTNPTNPVFVDTYDLFTYTIDDSGTYSRTWTGLDPTHEYIFGIGALASIYGFEDDWGGYVEVEITNLKANAVPEPATMFLFGIGVLAAGASRGRRRS